MFSRRITLLHETNSHTFVSTPTHSYHSHLKNTNQTKHSNYTNTQVPNLAEPAQADSNDCTLVYTDDGDKVYQVRGRLSCQLHCAQGHIPNPPESAYLQCETGFGIADTQLQSCDIGRCGEPPRETDMPGMDETFSQSCANKNHNSACTVQCQDGLSISGSGIFRCNCIVTEGFAGDYSMNCGWNTYGQTCVSNTQDCPPRTVENSDRGDSNPLEGSDPITVTCDAGYGGNVLERQWTCDQGSLLWTGESCDANACYPTQVANSDRSLCEWRELSGSFSPQCHQKKN